MGDISKNFNRSEFECKCGDCGCDTVDHTLLEMLQTIRDKFGALKITSGHRCEDHNKSVSGRPNSYHLQGRAADFQPLKADVIDVANFIEQENWPHGLGVYSDFIHLDSRNTKARWRG